MLTFFIAFTLGFFATFFATDIFRFGRKLTNKALGKEEQKMLK